MDGIFGQPEAIRLLKRSRDCDRMHHAWVFSGPRGVGKFTTAIAFAESILQRSFSNNSTNPDLHVIRKEDVAWSQNPLLRNRKQTNIPLDLIRERMIGGRTSDDKMHDAVAYKTPVLGNKKVFIVDEAELLDATGQNALLKTLEEPPAGTTIILVTSRDDLLLPTVKSRCQMVAFSPLDDLSMKKWTDIACGGVDPEELAMAVAFSCGSPGIAVEALAASLPELSRALSTFLDLNSGDGYSHASSLIISHVENSVEAHLRENPQASKEAANRRAAQRILMLFGQSVRFMVRGDRQDEGIVAAGILSDIEHQFSTNISIKVLLESLAARWSHLCRGDAVLV